MKNMGQTTQWILGIAFVVIMGVATTLSARLDKHEDRIRYAEINQSAIIVKVDHLKTDTEMILHEIKAVQEYLRDRPSLIAWTEEPRGFQEGD